jgi:hypothetical protein
MKTLRDIVKGKGDNILATSAICGVERQLGSGRFWAYKFTLNLNRRQSKPLSISTAPNINRCRLKCPQHVGYSAFAQETSKKQP